MSYCQFQNDIKNWSVLPELPYKKTDLEPYISANTLEIHREKHQQAYINNLLMLVRDSEDESSSLECLMKKYRSSLTTNTHKRKEEKIYNNAAQVYNHTFFWHSLKKGGGGEPTGSIANEIEKTYASHIVFLEKMTAEAALHFGSGWLWCVSTPIVNDFKIDSYSTDNAQIVKEKDKPLLVLDLWEHSYYLDYQNRRAEYVKNFFDYLINWEFANECLANPCTLLT
jgi:Fe-Mn family superoxide dismutase